MEEKKRRRWLAGFLAVIMTITGVGIPLPFPSEASDVWPQKSTAPFFCLDGGKGGKKVDRYAMYTFDTMPSPLTETQAKRLFWAYPDNWSALKNAAKQFDPELYAEIASTTSSANIVKSVKDDAGTKFAWVADNREIEDRAIADMEQASYAGMAAGKEAPDAIRDATSEETAVPFTVLPFSDGPGALDTEFFLGSELIREIAKSEHQRVWDSGSRGRNVCWLDACQDKNIARSVLGEELYEITWSGDSIKIHNNGSATANENALDSTMTEEQKYNKTMVRYKITMRKNSGWYTEGSWNDDYLHEWMDFKACVNAPPHQRLYKAGIEIVPSAMVFYIVVSQEGDGGGPDDDREPAYGGGETVQGTGGGVCQGSSTVYRAARRSNLEIVEREPHGYITRYVPDGMDATVYYGAKDFRFRNNTPFPIQVVGSVSGRSLTVSILGTKSDNITVEMTNQTVGTTGYKTVYKVDSSLPAGSTRVSVPPYAGYTVKGYLNR